MQRLVLLLLTLMPPALAGAHEDATATDIVQQALAAHGGMAAIEQAGGVQVSLDGEFDLTARLQGRSPFRPEPTPISEQIAIDTANNRLAYRIDWYNYYQSNQQLLEIIDAQQRMLFVDLRNRNGGWLPFIATADAQARYARMVPQLLLTDALEQRDSLETPGTGDVDGQPVHSVRYRTSAGDPLTLHIHRDTHWLIAADSPIDMPLLGMTTISWRWSDYAPAMAVAGMPALRFPQRFESHLGGRRMKHGKLSIQPGIDAEAFTVPGDIQSGDPPETLIASDEFIPYGQREPEIETLAPGVHMVVNLRPGFRLLFVEFEDFVLAVDAPTGWYEMQQIPPMNWSRGDNIDALGHKYLRAIRQTVPDKPARYLVLTHHHSDHIGGLQPFIDAGATILAGRAAAHMAALGRDETLDMELVSGQKTISDASMTMQLIELPDGNPKADNYLMVYLPHQKILYATAFIYPLPEAVFPPKESIPLARYFVEWLDGSGLDIEHIYNVHGQGLVEDWQLQKLRQLNIQ